MWTLGLGTKSSWGPLQKSFGPKKKIRQSAPSQQAVLAKAIWANWVFIQSCSNFFKEAILAYVDLGAWYKIFMGSLAKVIWTKKKN